MEARLSTGSPYPNDDPFFEDPFLLSMSMKNYGPKRCYNCSGRVFDKDKKFSTRMFVSAVLKDTAFLSNS